MHSALFSVCLSDNTTGKTYIMMEARLGALFKTESEYTLLEKWVQKTLQPLMKLEWKRPIYIISPKLCESTVLSYFIKTFGVRQKTWVRDVKLHKHIKWSTFAISLLVRINKITFFLSIMLILFFPVDTAVFIWNYELIILWKLIKAQIVCFWCTSFKTFKMLENSIPAAAQQVPNVYFKHSMTGFLSSFTTYLPELRDKLTDRRISRTLFYHLSVVLCSGKQIKFPISQFSGWLWSNGGREKWGEMKKTRWIEDTECTETPRSAFRLDLLIPNIGQINWHWKMVCWGT